MKKGILLPVITILVIAAVLLGASFGLNSIAAQKAQEDHLWLMQTLLPDSTEFVLEPYSGEDANIRSVHKAENGFVIETVTYGYAGEITMFIGVNNEGKVTGLVVRDLSETFGLGKEALTDLDFLKQFLNSSGTFEVVTGAPDAFSGATGEVTESTGDTVAVDALTGATVTSKAVVRAINSAVAYVTGADAASAATTWGG
jgi:electron transport complex protein RnfG